MCHPATRPMEGPDLVDMLDDIQFLEDAGGIEDQNEREQNDRGEKARNHPFPTTRHYFPLISTVARKLPLNLRGWNCVPLSQGIHHPGNEGCSHAKRPAF